MAYYDIFVTDAISAPAGWSVGASANSGASKASAVNSWRRVNRIIYDYFNGGGLDTPRIIIGRLNCGGLANYLGAAAVTGIGNYTNNCITSDGAVTTQTVPGGFVIVPDNAAQNWHLGDLRVAGNTGTGDWVQLWYKSGQYYYADPGSGVRTNIWAVSNETSGVGTLIDTNVANYAGRIVRVWRGGAANAASAFDKYAEMWEARNLNDLGNDGTRGWTQMAYPSGDTAMDTEQPDWGSTGSTLISRRLHVYCATNPYTAWGGVTFATQESQYGMLALRDIDGWTVSPDLIVCGGTAGSRGAGVSIDGCRDALYEAKHVISPFYRSTIQLNNYTSGRQIQRLQIAPYVDSNLSSMPYSTVGGTDHSNGAGDMIQFHADVSMTDVTFLQKASNGRQSVVRGMAHMGIGNQSPSGSFLCARLKIEPGVQFLGGMTQYCRGIALIGNPTNLYDYKIGGHMTGMRAPSQVHGSGVVSGLVLRNPGPMYEEDTLGAGSFTDRFGGVRTYGDVATNGRFRDVTGLLIHPQNSSQYVGEILVIDSDIECLGAGISYSRASYSGGSPRVTVANTVFRPSPNPGGLGIAVLIDELTNSPGNSLHLINNVGIGGIQCATSTGATDTKIAVSSFGQPTTSGGAATNVGWLEYPTIEAYQLEQARAKVA